ncbi:MAG: FeoB-associated Cys-rich membrane protein [Bacteroidota bacterium]
MLNFVIMNIQSILVLLIFAAALFYIGRMMYRNIFAKKGCGESCKCGVDFSNIDTGKAVK